MRTICRKKQGKRRKARSETAGSRRTHENRLRIDYSAKSINILDKAWNAVQGKINGIAQRSEASARVKPNRKRKANAECIKCTRVKP